MLSKLSVVCIAALAVIAQAGHYKRHTQSHKNGTFTHQPFQEYNHKPSAGYPGEEGTSSGVAPYPTTSTAGGYSPLGAGASPRLLTTGRPVPTFTSATIVTKLITYCPGPTTIIQNGKTYTVTKETTLTITDCPCTSTYTTTGLPTPSHSGETTLSYVIGTGLSTTTVVTTIRRTSYKTKYNTVYTSAKGGENGASSPPGYQTVRKTIQSTKYVYAGPTAAGRPAGSIEGGALDLVVCPAPVTVTVGQTITVTTTLTPSSSLYPSSAVVAASDSSARALSSAPYGTNNGTQSTGTSVTRGFLTKVSGNLTLKPSLASLAIMPSSSAASISGIAQSSGIAPSSSSSRSTGPAVMATAVMQGYN